MLHRTLLRLAGQVAGPVLAGAGVGLSLFAVRVVQAVLVGWVLAAVLAAVPAGGGAGGGEGGQGAGPPLGPALLALAVTVLVRAALVSARDVVAQVGAERIKERLRDRLLDRLFDLGPGYLVRARSGDVQSTVVDGVEALEAYYSRYLPQLVVALVGPPVVVAWIALRAPAVAAVVGTAVVAVPLLPRLWDRLLAERGRAHWDAYSALASDYLDSMQGMTTLKSTGATARRRAHLAARARDLLRATMRQMAVSLVDTGLTALGSQVGVAAAVGLGAWLVAGGDLPVAVLAVVLVLSAECLRPFQELSAHWHAGFLGVSAADGIAELLAAEAPSPDRADAVPLAVDAPGSIRFEHVRLTYPGQGEPALDDVTFDVPAGRTVAVVGRSGAGKTSLVSLLLRFLSPDQGRILVGGQDVASVSGADLRRRIALVSQDPYLFHGSVADNLRLARPDATDADLVAAARTAGAHEFVAALPGGYAALVGERGASLSGGQRQRLALARALLADASILVLDEATSAVDAVAEADILDGLSRAGAGRTTLVVAHRLSTVRSADRIVVLERGRLVEQGPPSVLLAAGGAYARLVRAQQVAAVVR